MTQQAINHEIRRTPLHRLHVELGGRFVAFAGYEMPIQYPAGILKEHLHTREQASLFDVSHMGQILLRPRSGVLQDAARALETLVPQDLLGLPEGRQRYALFTNSAGGILDDLMIANRGDHFQLIVNAAGKHADEAHLRTALGSGVRRRAPGRSRVARLARAKGRGRADASFPRRRGHAIHGRA